MAKIDQLSTTANGIEFAYLEAGPRDGKLALCLHGFPDTAHTYRYLLPALADAGYRAVAPWMRGYAPTAIPADGRYQTGALATDACALHESLGGDSDAVLIGHDWGAFAAYGAAAFEPHRWRRVVTMAVPPPSAMSSKFFAYDQLKRSFYVFFFQSPLAETALSMNDMEFIDHLWADWSPGLDAAWDISKVKEALGEPDHLSAAIDYYRAMFDPTRHDPSLEDAQEATNGSPPQPTLYLHGAQDGCMGIETFDDVEAHLSPGSKHVLVQGGGHFLHLDVPRDVNKEILLFLDCTTVD
ncbi:MAG TPA: alpha/beta hydrolase [Acidimicrobiales bacterium]|nr:alpha/beta hydrolase [Acidimicrobiales bacterium]